MEKMKGPYSPCGPPYCREMSTSENPAGWHPDPDGSGRERWWNGVSWTDQTRDRPSASPSDYVPADDQTHGGGVSPVGADKAIIALVCAILGLLCCGPLGIVAVVLGKGARDEAGRTGLPVDDKMNIAFYVGIFAVAVWLIFAAVRFS